MAYYIGQITDRNHMGAFKHKFRTAEHGEIAGIGRSVLNGGFPAQVYRAVRKNNAVLFNSENLLLKHFSMNKLCDQEVY